MESYNKLKEKENSLPIDRDLIELQKTIVHYGQKMNVLIEKMDEIINRIDKLQEETNHIKSLLTLEEDKEKAVSLKVENYSLPNSFINHLRKIK